MAVEPDAGRTPSGIVWIAAPADWFRVLVPPRPLTAAEALRDYPRALVLLDGAMFTFCPGEPHDYARYNCASLPYGAVDPLTGARNPSLYPDRGGTLTVTGNMASVASGWSTPPWGGVAWQGYPLLVSGGVPERFTGDADRVERAAVGLLPDGRVVFATGVSGMAEFARGLAGLGLSWAAYSDGGGSTALVVKDGERILEDRPGNAVARRVASFVGFSPNDRRAW